MRRTSCFLLFTIALGLMACLWDDDTLDAERARFPSALELITGRFPRHSPAFYQWKIADRKKKLEKNPKDIRLYDDLAVAYDKLGDHDAAIQMMLEKERIQPGLYETEANLGTFLIHSGKLEEGREHIAKAIEINPDAHLGREVYQLLLVDYVLSRRVGETTKLPLTGGRRFFGEPAGFAEFVRKQRFDDEPNREQWEAEVKRAIKGVLGMMRFGNYRSPVLLEALGDLLIADPGSLGAKQLAARAYLKASYELDDPDARAAYRNLAKSALALQTVRPRTSTQMPLSALERQLKRELAEAEAWYASIQSDEQRWIAEGKDVSAEYRKKYLVPWPQSTKPSDRTNGAGFYPLLVISAAIIIMAALAFVLYRMRHKPKHAVAGGTSGAAEL